MDDVIQILVFVVTIVIFIASAVIKQKKKPNGKSSNFESVVESLFGIPSEVNQPVKSPIIKDYYEEEEDFVIVESKKTEKEYEEGVRSIKLENNVNRVELIEEEEDDEDQFDLRQAIIYSEIINRKEF